MWVRIACVVAALVAAGCTTTGTGTGPAEPSATPSSSLPAGFPLVYPGPPATIALGDEGTLHIDTDSLCVTLTDDGGHVRVIAFSEEVGATVDLSDPANPLLVMEGCRPLGDGDYVWFYGVGHGMEREALEEYFDLADLQRCGTTVEDVALVGYCSGASHPRS